MSKRKKNSICHLEDTQFGEMPLRKSVTDLIESMNMELAS
jgi:hypothetical protein